MTEENIHTITNGIDNLLQTETPLLTDARKSSELHRMILKHVQEIQPGISIEEFKELVSINDFHAFTLYSSLDLYVTIKTMVAAKTEWERIYAIKHAYLIMYESIKAFYVHNIGLQQILKTSYPSMLDAYALNADEIKKFGKSHGYPAKMKKIRVNIAAHFEKDFVTYYDTIRELNSDDAMVAVMEFMEVLRNLQQFLGKFVSEANVQWTQKGIDQEDRIKSLITGVEELFAKHAGKHPGSKEIQDRVQAVMDRIKGDLKS